MATSAHVQGFLPSTNGLHFDNSWPSEPDVTVQTPSGPIGLGDAANGLCGGMAYTVRDFFENALPIPIDATNPAPGTPLFDYIVRRLLDSFDLPFGVPSYVWWQGLGVQAKYRNTVTSEWPKIKNLIDAGTLAPVYLMRVNSLNPADLGHNHQVLAYGYTDTGSHVTLRLYDPNHHDHDDITLDFGIADPNGTPDVSFEAGGHHADDEVTFGCFVTTYRHVTPPSRLTLATPRVVYRAANGTVQELSLPVGGGWAAGQPASPLGPEPAVGDPMGYVSALDATLRVVYRDGAGHIRELSLPPGGEWSPGDLTSLTPAPATAGDPWGYASPSGRQPGVEHAPDEVPRVVYRGVDAHIWELSLPIGGAWTSKDLTRESAAPPALGEPVGYLDWENIPRVVFRAAAGHAIGLTLFPSNVWGYSDLTADLAASAMAGDAWPYFTPADDRVRLVYRGVDAHIHELSCVRGGAWNIDIWSTGDLTSLARLPDAAGDPHAYVTPRDMTARVVYRDIHDHISEASLPPGGPWSPGDLTALGSGTTVVGDPFGYASFLDHTARVVYRDGTGHLHEISLPPGGVWTDWDVSGRTGAVPAAGDPSAYVG